MNNSKYIIGSLLLFIILVFLFYTMETFAFFLFFLGPYLIILSFVIFLIYTLILIVLRRKTGNKISTTLSQSIFIAILIPSILIFVGAIILIISTYIGEKGFVFY